MQSVGKILFIAGIPGTGKTTIGNYLRDVHGFYHLDMENAPQILRSFLNDDYEFLDEILLKNKKVVITWGFLPDHLNILSIVEKIVDRNTKYTWFDGDRESAKKNFLKRGTVPEHLFDLQIRRINDTNIVKRWSPTILNTFDKKGNFLPKSIIAEQLIEGFS